MEYTPPVRAKSMAIPALLVGLVAGGVVMPSARTMRAAAPSGGFDQKLFGEMRWRSIGPLRGGRTKAATGVAQQPYTFYLGVVNGGVWKTTDAGRTWKPIFDDQPTGSIGSIAVAPSDPNIVFVGSGEGLARPDLSVGDGIYKSTNAGATWTHLGLRDGQQIPNIAIDATNPDRLFVAVAGHPYGPNEERGIFRSTDGGKTFERVLYKDENTGGADVDIDPANPNTVYATLWEERQGPWENASWRGSGGGIFNAASERRVYVSFDDGDHWQSLQLNMAPSSVRDLTVKDDDLIAATHGRGFWILDNVTPLQVRSVRRPCRLRHPGRPTPSRTPVAPCLES